MASQILSYTNSGGSRLSVVRAPNRGSVLISRGQKDTDIGPTMKKFYSFWELMDTVNRHGYLRAATSVVGRATVGAWWSLVRHPEYGKSAPDGHRRKLYRFYMMHNRTWDNIKDYQSFAYKFKVAAMYLHYFGQAAFSIVRDEFGIPIGLDFLHGLVIPNIDRSGNFKSPAFVQYTSVNYKDFEVFNDPRDVVFITNPDMSGSPMGGSDIESLTTYSLPLDLYLQTAAREYMKNRNTPEMVYQLPADISDEAFDAFVARVDTMYAGPENLGRNPIAVQGEFDVKELRPFPKSLPYQEARRESREEELAVSGVAGAKLGLTDAMASANIRETRREFHESTMISILRFLELGFYEQVHVREFDSPGWMFKCNNPDFLTAVERATVHMRYKQIGALNANEIRAEIGKEPREDSGGEEYEDMDSSDGDNAQGSPPEGRPVEPDDPSQTGEPTLDDQDPPRGDQHDEEPRDRIIRELKLWKGYAVRRIRKGRKLRAFYSDVIPEDISKIIVEHLQMASTLEDVAKLFDDAIEEIMEAFDGA